jgi:hypothetical protein
VKRSEFQLGALLALFVCSIRWDLSSECDFGENVVDRAQMIYLELLCSIKLMLTFTGHVRLSIGKQWFPLKRTLLIFYKVCLLNCTQYEDWIIKF